MTTPLIHTLIHKRKRYEQSQLKEWQHVAALMKLLDCRHFVSTWLLLLTSGCFLSVLAAAIQKTHGPLCFSLRGLEPAAREG